MRQRKKAATGKPEPGRGREEVVAVKEGTINLAEEKDRRGKTVDEREESGKTAARKGESRKLVIRKDGKRKLVIGKSRKGEAEKQDMAKRGQEAAAVKREGGKTEPTGSAARKPEPGRTEPAPAEPGKPETVEIEKIETEVADKKSQNLMNLIRRVHGLVENPDIEKHRQSQDYIGTILGNTKSIHYREVDVEGMYGEWVSVNRAHMKKYIILHCHGGGYSTGSSLYARTLTSKLAESTSMDVFCFDYRLAPENPYPAAVEDAMKAWNYLMLLGYGARDVVLTGDSAGGNLALSLALRLKGEGRLLPRGMVLMSPWTDLTSSGKSFQTKADLDPVLNGAYIDRMVKAYAEGQDLEDARISPLFGDFEGFPPVYIQVGENEILLSDSLRLHQAFIDANVSVKIDVWPGMWHVFQMSPMKAAWNAMDKNAEFIYDICR